MAWKDISDRSVLRVVVSLAITLLALGGCTLVPHPLTDAERLAEADGDRAEMYGKQDPLRHPLTLHEAFARALKYNLDGRVKLVEEALAVDDLDSSRLRSAAQGLHQRRRHLAQQRSCEFGPVAGDLGCGDLAALDLHRPERFRLRPAGKSWNILGFRCALFCRASRPDRVLIGHEERRKVIRDAVGGCPKGTLARRQRAAAQSPDHRFDPCRRSGAAERAQGRDRRPALAGRFAALPEGAARSDTNARKLPRRCSPSPRSNWRS